MIFITSKVTNYSVIFCIFDHSLLIFNIINCYMKRFFSVVALLFFIGCEVIFVEDISDDAVQILAPQENTAVDAGSINFFWGDLDQVDSYRVQIATPSFESASQILLDTILTDLTLSKEIVSGSYQWRVKAINSEYETGYSTASFTVN